MEKQYRATPKPRKINDYQILVSLTEEQLKELTVLLETFGNFEICDNNIITEEDFLDD